MHRWTMLALALVPLPAVALAGDDPGGGSRPAARVAVRPHTLDVSRKVRVGATSQFDLARRVPLAVRVRGLQGRGLTLRARLVTPDGTPHRLSDPIRVPARRADARHVFVRSAVARLARPCATYRLDVEVLDPRGHAVARTQRRIAPSPPDCGRFFAATSWWNRPLAADAPLDPLSATLAAELKAQVDRNFAMRFYPSINTTSYTTPIYTVPATQRRVPVRLSGSEQSWRRPLAETLGAGVPIPDGARPSAGHDGHLTVWQPGTDTLWELWHARLVDGRWHADWGGAMSGASRAEGAFSDPLGAPQGGTATSLPLVGGLITLADLRRGSIDHALAIAIPRSRRGVWALPAQRSDGSIVSDTAIPAGARFRLDPSLDVDALGLPPFTAMLAKAVQRYGMFVRDTSPVVTFYGEDPTPAGDDPWPAALQPSGREILRSFPWDRLQVTRMALRTYSGRRVSR
jgi:hypothetical protein